MGDEDGSKAVGDAQQVGLVYRWRAENKKHPNILGKLLTDLNRWFLRVKLQVLLCVLQASCKTRTLQHQHPGNSQHPRWQVAAGGLHHGRRPHSSPQVTELTRTLLFFYSFFKISASTTALPQSWETLWVRNTQWTDHLFIEVKVLDKQHPSTVTCFCFLTKRRKEHNTLNMQLSVSVKNRGGHLASLTIKCSLLHIFSSLMCLHETETKIVVIFCLSLC